jgi:hypothetical protein
MLPKQMKETRPWIKTGFCRSVIDRQSREALTLRHIYRLLAHTSGSLLKIDRLLLARLSL